MKTSSYSSKFIALLIALLTTALSTTALMAAPKSTTVVLHNASENFILKYVSHTAPDFSGSPDTRELRPGDQAQFRWARQDETEVQGVLEYSVYSADGQLHYGSIYLNSMNYYGSALPGWSNCSGGTYHSNFTDLITTAPPQDVNGGPTQSPCRDKFPVGGANQEERLYVQLIGDDPRTHLYFYDVGTKNNQWVGAVCLLSEGGAVAANYQSGSKGIQTANCLFKP